MFYQKSIQDILKECESSLEGLNDFQVKNHIVKYGKNELVEKKERFPSCHLFKTILRFTCHYFNLCRNCF